MRDLGLMGENTFSLWCADGGLVPNGSQVDKTGWDFLVEFPFSSDVSPDELHKPACECRVQVKATDDSKRKVSIPLSNLRRLITAQMPSFFVFIEFDKKEAAQRAFVVHVDNALISKVLERLHKIEQSEKENRLNKRTMTIHYDESHKLNGLNGDSLKRQLLSHIGKDLSEYIANKKSHLESTGYENGFGQVTFSTESEDDFKKLIDLSLGIEKKVSISNIKGVNCRFGILAKNPHMDAEKASLEMPDLKPTSKGIIKFKEGKLSPGISFEANLFNSPFNHVLPDNLKKFRIEGEFFDLMVNPFTGAASYSFSLGDGIRLEVIKFKDAIRLLQLLTSSGKSAFAELKFEGLPKLQFRVGCSSKDFDFSEELKALDDATKLISMFEVSDCVDISFEEVSRYKTEISQMYALLESSPDLFRVEFGVVEGNLDLAKECACIFLVSTPVGSHVFGAVLVLSGNVEVIENDRYRLISSGLTVERYLVSEIDETIPGDLLATAVEEVEGKYKHEYSIVSLFDKDSNDFHG